MGATPIQWTDHSLNPIRARRTSGIVLSTSNSGHYCEKVSPGCKYCYSSRMQPRFGLPQFQEQRGDDAIEPFFDGAALEQVLHRRKPTKWFWCDMTDMFGSWVPFEWIAACFGVMAATPQHTHQILTKRPERAAEFFRWYEGSSGAGASSLAARAAADELLAPAYRKRLAEQRAQLVRGFDPDEAWPLPKVHLGVSCENQATYDERLPKLVHQVPAAVHWASLEPLLGPIDLRGTGRIHLDWFVVGGESGAKARPCHVEWIRSLIAQAKESEIPAFVKQLGRRPQLDPSERSEADRNDAREACRRAKGLGSPFPNDEWRAFMKPWRLVDSHGGDPGEWPEDLRIREFPRSA